MGTRAMFIPITLTDRQWNVLEVALDRFIEDQNDDGSDDAKYYAARAEIVKNLMQCQLGDKNGN